MSGALIKQRNLDTEGDMHRERTVQRDAGKTPPEDWRENVAAKEHLGLPEVGRGEEGPFPSGFRENQLC